MMMRPLKGVITREIEAGLASIWVIRLLIETQLASALTRAFSRLL